MNSKFGIYIGRFQPFTIAHQAIINEIIMDGRIPVIILGSCNKHDSNNPFTAEDRIRQILAVFTEFHGIFVRIDDNDDWQQWYDNLISKTAKQISNFIGDCDLPISSFDTVFYINNKPEDLSSFEWKDRRYVKENYNIIFSIEDHEVKQVKYPKLLGLTDISARKVRNNLEENKYMLDYRVYDRIKV